MLAENLKIFGFIVLALLVTVTHQKSKKIKSYDEERLFQETKEPTNELKDLVENIFKNVSKSINKTESITTLKFTSHDDSKEISLWNGGTRNTYLIDKSATIALKAYGELLKNKEAYSFINSLKIPAPYCPKEDNIYCNPNYPYRSINGSCNNLIYVWWGMKESPYKRMLPPDYEDGVSAPRMTGVNGKRLPNERELALVIHKSRESESIWSLFWIYFGQNMAHDLTLIASVTYGNGKPKKCGCNSYDPDCLSIPTPYGDYAHSNQKCQSITRSSSSFKDFNCNLGAREQINLVTHWLDMSQLYGSDINVAYKIRTFKNGQLKTSYIKYSNLPQLPQKEGSTCPSDKRTEKCFDCGDSRCEDNLMLLSVHALWLREHNRIAKYLSRLNKHWDDETIYQETRRIIIAEYQHIVYNEYLPVLVGEKVAYDFGLIPLKYGYLKEYDPYIYPQILNEFAVAGLRICHTLVPLEHKRADKYYNIYGERDVDYYQFHSSLVLTGPFDDITYGIVNRSSYDSSPAINPSMNNYLFKGIFSNEYTKQWSLAALNIIRGKDHGIRGYNYYRKKCGLNYAYKFSDLTNISPHIIKKLEKLYDNVNDIDLFVGLVTEYPLKDAAVGPTAACIIAKEFSDLKYGDRFYYENGQDENTKFTLDQLNEIRKASAAALLCDNTEIEFVQDSPFMMPNKNYAPWVDCDKIPRLNLKVWKDYY